MNRSDQTPFDSLRTAAASGLQTDPQAPLPARRGFASMDPARQRAISSKGGSAPHAVARGFAALSAERRREISQLGLKARRAAGG